MIIELRASGREMLIEIPYGMMTLSPLAGRQLQLHVVGTTQLPLVTAVKVFAVALMVAVAKRIAINILITTAKVP